MLNDYPLPEMGTIPAEVIFMKGIFALGAVGYPILEFLYRGRTHYSMSIAGGAAALLINHIRKQNMSLIAKSFLCGIGITAIECACGAMWNRAYQVWDYRRMPLNWRGQACLPYTLLWCGLSAGFICALDLWDNRKSRT